MLAVAPCLTLGEASRGCRPGGLRDPAGGFWCECDTGLRGRLYDGPRGDV
jgi:hypothetical protein